MRARTHAHEGGAQNPSASSSAAEILGFRLPNEGFRWKGLRFHVATLGCGETPKGLHPSQALGLVLLRSLVPLPDY